MIMDGGTPPLAHARMSALKQEGDSAEEARDRDALVSLLGEAPDLQSILWSMCSFSANKEFSLSVVKSPREGVGGSLTMAVEGADSKCTFTCELSSAALDRAMAEA